VRSRGGNVGSMNGEKSFGYKLSGGSNDDKKTSVQSDKRQR
jgi:hypothetical protein